MLSGSFLFHKSSMDALYRFRLVSLPYHASWVTRKLIPWVSFACEIRLDYVPSHRIASFASQPSEQSNDECFRTRHAIIVKDPHLFHLRIRSASRGHLRETQKKQEEDRASQHPVAPTDKVYYSKSGAKAASRNKGVMIREQGGYEECRVSHTLTRRVNHTPVGI